MIAQPCERSHCTYVKVGQVPLSIVTVILECLGIHSCPKAKLVFQLFNLNT